MSSAVAEKIRSGEWTPVYDPDHGLMHEIERLIAEPRPSVPVDAPPLEKKRRGRPRKWRTDAVACSVCNLHTGGDLVFCDGCPAAFHLDCHEPALSQEGLPAGKWFCNRCSHDPNREDRVPVAGESEEDRNAAAAARVWEEGRLKGLSPLELLLNTAVAQNAQHFSLPPHFDPNPPAMPGDALLAPRHEISHKRCSHCGLFVSPSHLFREFRLDDRKLVACDFCSLLWHLDCVDPPLTTVPKERWMCGAHVEQLIDRHLLKTSSVLERRRLWAEFGKESIDENHVKMNFLRVARKRRDDAKGCNPVRPALRVPPSVKMVYETVRKQNSELNAIAKRLRREKREDDKKKEDRNDDARTRLEMALREADCDPRLARLLLGESGELSVSRREGGDLVVEERTLKQNGETREHDEDAPSPELGAD